MGVSIFLAQAMSLYLIITAIAMLFKKQRFHQVIRELVESPASLFIVAIMTLILGIILILVHNIWVADWHLIVTLLAWLTFIAGLVRTFLPEMIIKAASKIEHNGFYYTIAIVSLVIGLYLAYMGFFSF